jgi:hypothetical protein
MVSSSPASTKVIGAVTSNRSSLADAMRSRARPRGHPGMGDDAAPASGHAGGKAKPAEREA